MLTTYHACFLDLYPGLEVVVLPSEERREGHDDGRRPDQQDHPAHRAEVAGVDVVNLRHRPISKKK